MIEADVEKPFSASKMSTRSLDNIKQCLGVMGIILYGKEFRAMMVCSPSATRNAEEPDSSFETKPQTAGRYDSISK